MWSSTSNTLRQICVKVYGRKRWARKCNRTVGKPCGLPRYLSSAGGSREHLPLHWALSSPGSMDWIWHVCSKMGFFSFFKRRKINENEPKQSSGSSNQPSLHQKEELFFLFSIKVVSYGQFLSHFCIWWNILSTWGLKHGKISTYKLDFPGLHNFWRSANRAKNLWPKLWNLVFFFLFLQTIQTFNFESCEIWS